MDYIYLDTSIFVKENFLEGNRIKTFFKLFTESRFQLVMSIIAISEVKNQFKKSARLAIEKHNELLNRREMGPLRNVPQSEVRSTKFPALNQLCESFNSLFEEQLEKANVEILPYPTMNIEEVFSDYFSSKFPFNVGEKKNEFPDAFALWSLVHWCTENHKTCIVFSKDKDFLKFNSEKLTIKDNYEEFLDEYLKLESGRMVILDILVVKNQKYINDRITAWVINQLDDIGLYYDFSNYLDVHDITFEKIDVEDPTYNVIGVEKDQILIEMKVDVYVEIDISIDDEESGYYDGDDRGWHYFDTTVKTIQQHANIPLNVLFHITSDDEFYEDSEVVEINNREKFKLRRPKYGY